MMSLSIAIEPARREDLADVLALLERQSLPVEGASHLGNRLMVARVNGRIVGAAGLELYTAGALLRSVVVDTDVQGQGLGQRLTEAALALARTHGMAVVFLLTTTAESFFSRFGFERIGRGDVPESVRQSIEFRSACPASAIAMRKHLR